ncbi:ATP-binding protein [Planctobacterium marinum]|uniref:ATP-binding protein n=1 Tax=Planctobacterium marinum TaxID=1631968 RepID=UPI001E2A26E3|nr:ATP-binding protein [Planctobacterium marinum]MCC2605322.1 HAMP domain-containing histidine kinase [Planctobacterium marinum]
MNSIQKKLSRYLSISISILLVAILLATDISVDTWISKEFDRAMINKVGLLETLVEEDEDEVDFDFAGEFMPEFEGKENPEYFQLWYNNEVFERSDTLEFFEVKDLPRLDVNLDRFIIQDITLPDGRDGRMLFSKFLPQVDSDIREALGVTREEFAKNQKPMEFAYALSKEDLNYILWFVDVIFILTSIIAVFTVRKIVSLVVVRSLKPIDEFTQELSNVSLTSDNADISIENLPEELIPIANATNQFIQDNRNLYQREQRVTSDIAHELKTPIAELLSLSEVALKFPHEKQITDNLANDVKEISTRLKSIVNGILLLQKSNSSQALPTTEVDLIAMFNNVLSYENKSNRQINADFESDSFIITTNKFALETVLSNLISNAIYYSPENTVIDIVVKTRKGKTHVEITNTCEGDCCEGDLNQFFEPLWQKDDSRTSTERFGLGLAIVKSYCQRLGATISVSLDDQNRITFSIVL